MNRKMPALAVSIVAMLLINLGAATPTQASSILMAKGFVHFSDGTPFSQTRLVVFSTDPVTKQELSVSVLTDANGKFKAQAFSNYFVEILPTAPYNIENVGYVFDCGGCRDSPQYSGILSAENLTIDVLIPLKTGSFTFNVRTESGAPIPGLDTNLRERTWSNSLRELFFYQGNNSETDENGISRFPIVLGGLPKYGGNEAGYVSYEPFEGVSLTRRVTEEEYASGGINLTLLDVPSAEISVPTSLKSTESYNLDATILNSDGTPAVEPKALRVAFSQVGFVRTNFQKVELYQRSFKSGKWSEWSRISKATVASNGKVKFLKLKFTKGKFQLSIRGTNFSLGSKVKTVLSK